MEPVPFTLIFCDVNNFKDFNDTYGHSFGDTILKRVSKRLKETVRSYDMVVRYGGDEFVAILESTTSEESAAVLLRMHQAFDPFTVEVDGATAVEVRASFGFASGFKFSKVFEAADENMYDHKE